MLYCKVVSMQGWGKPVAVFITYHNTCHGHFVFHLLIHSILHSKICIEQLSCGMTRKGISKKEWPYFSNASSVIAQSTWHCYARSGTSSRNMS